MALVRKGLHIRLGKKTLQISLSRVLVYIFILALLCFTALPLIYVVSTAFKPIDEMLKFPPQFFVRRPTMQNFKDLILAAGSASVPFLRGVANSVFVVVISVFSSVIVSSLGAYSVAKLDLPCKRQIMNLVVFAIAFPSSLVRIPTYLIIKNLGLFNTYWAIILPSLGTAFNFFMMRQFCQQIPNPLLEAARLDGANELRIFISIVFPFLTPAWATLVVFCFMSVWNESGGLVLYITDEAMRTLPIVISSIGGGLARQGASAAAGLLMLTPTIIIYTALQGRVIETMAHSGIK
ncbi:MAG: carbohydrate ABC transporter permease [Oscillospiraceae bacterium]|nr:carbohydrate ABC transporter permease [Oscillospiraceae bacterium]